MAVAYRKHYMAQGKRTVEAVSTQVPPLPEAVRVTCVRKGICLTRVRYDAGFGCWFVPDYKGMWLGIEADGHAHT